MLPSGLRPNHQSNSSVVSPRAPQASAEQARCSRRGGDASYATSSYELTSLEVPSAALKRRRACVPATVSLTAIRSHAPASTSSNVRDGYGSTL